MLQVRPYMQLWQVDHQALSPFTLADCVGYKSESRYPIRRSSRSAHQPFFYITLLRPRCSDPNIDTSDLYTRICRFEHTDISRLYAGLVGCVIKRGRRCGMYIRVVHYPPRRYSRFRFGDNVDRGQSADTRQLPKN
jgi:hypothetical protein